MLKEKSYYCFETSAPDLEWPRAKTADSWESILREISLALTTFHQRQDISQNSELQMLGSLFLSSFVFPHSGCFAFCLTTCTFQKGKRYHWVVWTACSMKYFSFGWIYEQIYCQIQFSNKIYVQFFHSLQHQDLWTYGTHFFPVMQTLTESMQTVRIWCHYLNLKNIKIWRSHYSVYILKYPPSWSYWWCSLSRSNCVSDAHKSWNPDLQLPAHLQGWIHHQPPLCCLYQQEKQNSW